MALTCSYNRTPYRSTNIYAATEITGNFICGESALTNDFWFYNQNYIDPVLSRIEGEIPDYNVRIFSSFTNTYVNFSFGNNLSNYVKPVDITNKKRIYFIIHIINFDYPLRVTADTSLNVYTIPACLITCNCYPENNAYTIFKGTFTQSIPNVPLDFYNGLLDPNSEGSIPINYENTQYGAPYKIGVNKFPYTNGQIATSLLNNEFEFESNLSIREMSLNGIQCTEIPKPFNQPKKVVYYYHQPFLWDLITLFILLGIWVLFEIWVLYSLRTPWKFHFSAPPILPKINTTIPYEKKKHHFLVPKFMDEEKDSFPNDLTSDKFPKM